MESGLAKGHTHWSELKWLKKARKFLEEQLKIPNLTDFEAAATVVILYPQMGKESKEQKRGVKNQKIQEILGEEGKTLFKKIFKNNNREIVNKFFKERIIRELW